MGRLCLPNMFTSPDDASWLGAPCSSSCADGGVCVRATGAASGFCSSVCSTNDDCLTYVGIQTACVPVTGGSVCAQKCTQASECLTGMSCRALNGTSVCWTGPASVDGGAKDAPIASDASPDAGIY